MGIIRKRLAILLAALLLLPSQPTIVFGQLGQKETGLTRSGENGVNIGVENGLELKEEQEDFEEDEEIAEEFWEIDLLADEMATPSNIEQEPEISENEISFNTGNHTYYVVSREDFFDRGRGDAYFEEDGSYTINIPEENPFFPYEVEFTYNNETIREWFMTPDDSVEIGDHIFYVSAYFDGTAVTQMNLEIAGDIVAVYPEEKDFTDDGGEELLSLDRKSVV